MKFFGTDLEPSQVSYINWVAAILILWSGVGICIYIPSLSATGTILIGIAVGWLGRHLAS